MSPEWWEWQKRKARYALRLWAFAALLLGSTIGYTHVLLKFGHMNPSSAIPFVIALPLGTATSVGVFWLLFVRGRP